MFFQNGRLWHLTLWWVEHLLPTGLKKHSLLYTTLLYICARVVFGLCVCYRFRLRSPEAGFEIEVSMQTVYREEPLGSVPDGKRKQNKAGGVGLWHSHSKGLSHSPGSSGAGAALPYLRQGPWLAFTLPRWLVRQRMQLSLGSWCDL